jgi:glycosyltransferase involved in cell wall biosynthesis
LFVRRRADALRSPRVIAPHSYRGSTLGRYLGLSFRALTARGRFDGVEVHWLFPTGLIGLVAARLRGIPLLVYAHGDDVVVTPHRNALYRFLVSQVCQRADVIVTNSEATAEHIRTFEAQANVIPPGLDLTRFRPSPRPRARRVLFMGGTAAEKGLDVAETLADTLIGPGIDERAHTEIPSIIAEHDIVLVPSRRESFGLAAAEAIASGRWVVAAAVGGLPGVVEDGINGTLVWDGDFAKAIASVPDYDPVAVSATAGRFDAAVEQDRLKSLWETLLDPR